ncbi:MAG TPA: LemA family protein, partial [Abditibacteriaceae bacterium]
QKLYRFKSQSRFRTITKRNRQNCIAQACHSYNTNVRELNNAVEVSPSNTVASIGAFQGAEYFKIEEAEARGPVKVKF